MKIKRVRAAAVRDLRPFRNPDALRAARAAGNDSANPLSRYREFAGQGERFGEPWPPCVCIVTAEDGAWGCGMTSHAGPVAPIVNECFAPLIEGEDAFATERLWNMMVRLAGARFGAAGLASYALSAVDLALWDLKGKVLGRPVYELLGGRRATGSTATPPASTSTGTWSSASRPSSSPPCTGRVKAPPRWPPTRR